MTGRAANPIFGSQPTTIFAVMSALANDCGAINLGQGFPDEDGPKIIREMAARALLDGPNQYAPMRGIPQLRRAIAAHSKRFHGLEFDPESEIVVTSGATEALAASMIGLAGAGDEAITIEPAYDCYRPILEGAGVTVKSVQLQPPDWRLDERSLAAAFGPRTKLVVVNTPLNPIGRAFSHSELQILAALAKRHDAFVVCDEVYEHMLFDGREHVPVVGLPGMRERTVRIGSAGKIFSLTGWKVGWIEGPAPLIRAIANAHQFLTFATSPALQLGIAYGLEHEMDFTLNLTRELQQKRDMLATTLAGVDFDVLPCEGTYFLTVGIRNVTNEPDTVFCERLTRAAGVAAIPVSAFCGLKGPKHLVRFAFCKKQSVLNEVARRLDTHFRK